MKQARRFVVERWKGKKEGLFRMPLSLNTANGGSKRKRGEPWRWW